MIEIIASKEVNLVTNMIPKEKFETIKTQLDALVDKAQIRLTYYPTNKNLNRMYVKCLATDAAKQSVQALLRS